MRVCGKVDPCSLGLRVERTVKKLTVTHMVYQPESWASCQLLVNFQTSVSFKSPTRIVTLQSSVNIYRPNNGSAQ